jgi:glycosyltransferase involved in cell wall biosynthesis
MIETIVEKHADIAPIQHPERKLRVAILALPNPGGVAYYGALLANALSQYLKVMLIISEAMRHFQFNPRLEVVCVRKNKILSMPNPVAYRRIFRLLKHFNPDLVHDSSGNACKWSFGLWPFIARRWPLVITEHDPQPHPGMGGCFPHMTRRFAWKSAHHFIVHGKQCRQALLGAGIGKHKVSINRHGSFEVYNQSRHTNVIEEENTVLFFGALRPNKGIHRLSTIAQKVQTLFPAAKFIVAGKRTRLSSQKEAAKVCQTVEALKSIPGFEVHDRFVNDDEVECFFRRSALVILPYEEASQSGVIPLAYAFRKPVVAFDVGDLNESIVDGETGILVRSGDEDAYAREIVALLVDANKRHAMGQRAKVWAARELSWDLIADRTIHIYNEALAVT